MINLNFSISNPWQTNKIWNTLWTKNGLFTENKAWEFNGYRTSRIINIEFEWTLRGDHAGARIMLGVFGYEIDLAFHDRRHWDYDLATWKCYK